VEGIQEHAVAAFQHGLHRIRRLQCGGQVLCQVGAQQAPVSGVPGRQRQPGELAGGSVPEPLDVRANLGAQVIATGQHEEAALRQVGGGRQDIGEAERAVRRVG